MPVRRTPLVTGEYYHIFNRTQNKEPFFVRKRDCERTIQAIAYYKAEFPPVRLSHYLSYGVDKRAELIKKIAELDSLIEINSFCLMPNHFHLLIKQLKSKGISKYMANIQNSLTKFRNLKYEKEGHLFKGRFKAVRIEDDEQLLHVHRYIHLNPYSSLIVKEINELINYPYSSLCQYLGIEEGFCELETVLSHFENVEIYKNFIFDQADYQRKLEQVKHLTLE